MKLMFHMMLLGAVAAAGCGQSPPTVTVDTRFENKATAGWNVAGTPDVTSMTIDGRP